MAHRSPLNRRQKAALPTLTRSRSVQRENLLVRKMCIRDRFRLSRVLPSAVFSHKYSGDWVMTDELIDDVVRELLPHLDNSQAKQLKKVLKHHIECYDVQKGSGDAERMAEDNRGVVHAFISAKRIEGCSEKTLKVAMPICSRISPFFHPQ